MIEVTKDYAKSITKNETYQKYLSNAYLAGIKYGLEMSYFFEKWIENNAIWIRTEEEMMYKHKEKEYTKIELFEYFLELQK